MILFSSDPQLKKFRKRIGDFQSGALTKGGQPQHNSLIANIESVGAIKADDRIGRRLRLQGFTVAGATADDSVQLIDVEIWDAETRQSRNDRVTAIVGHIEAAGGEVHSRYVGAGLIVLRVEAPTCLVRALCQVQEVAFVDLPPVPDLDVPSLSKIGLADFEAPSAPPPSAPLIGIIDSGVSAHPFLEPATIASFGVPATLGDADMNGHGTRVAGIALFGDVAERIKSGNFSAPFGLISARVVDEKGRFDAKSTIPGQMREAIRQLHERGCRIINISLGDGDKIAYADERATPWAATLDTMARELDIVIIVSAGNSAGGPDAPWGDPPVSIVTRYPSYLLEPSNRIIDPAMGACIVTVGALAHGNGLRLNGDETADVRMITEAGQPTPITRAGPGINGAVKPEFVDYGGTGIFDGFAQKLLTGAHRDSAGVSTTNAAYQDALFTSATGTSMAAPLVAFKTGLLLRRFPSASANLLRALHATCARVPEAALSKLNPVAKDAAMRCCGYGLPDVQKALSSEEERLIRYADRQDLEIDQFALFEVPITEAFRGGSGARQIRVTLAFDPPVRHTRQEYLGVRMDFRLIRGMTPDQIYEHYRKRAKYEAWPDLPRVSKCKLEPGFDARATSTLQSAVFEMKRDVERFGDTYYLAVFANRRWAGPDVTHQRFAATVELTRQGEFRIYEQSRIREEIRQRQQQRA